jgi:hypothetical protein
MAPPYPVVGPKALEHGYHGKGSLHTNHHHTYEDDKMRTQVEMETDLEYLKAFVRSTATVLEDIRKRLDNLESNADTRSPWQDPYDE